MSRICEVEDSVFEWYDRKYYAGAPPIEELDLSLIEKHFDIKKFECAGTDFVIYKLHLVARTPGLFYDKQLGLPIAVKKTVLMHEIKRVGYWIDRAVDFELRAGDHLLVYLQMEPKWRPEIDDADE